MKLFKTAETKNELSKEDSLLFRSDKILNVFRDAITELDEINLGFQDLKSQKKLEIEKLQGQVLVFEEQETRNERLMSKLIGFLD